MPAEALVQSQVPGYTPRRGKVRDVYDLGDKLVIVATDRISAFDYVLQPGIPNKGRILTAMTLFWLKWLDVPNHFLSANLADMPAEFRQPELEGRAMLVKKTTVIPIECVARGYLAGSGWKEYQASQTVCGIPLPAGLQLADRLPQPIFTPATKAASGHDENISFDTMAQRFGLETARTLQARTLDIYQRAADYAGRRGILLADTKLEWGRLPSGEIILIDEVLTPDSSRYWSQDSYCPGVSPPSFDKQLVRDWLESTAWDKASPPPPLPADVVEKTLAKYQEVLERLTR